MMNVNDQNRECHPERSEGSDAPATEILRFAQDDIPGLAREISSLRPYTPFAL
jgi:hypothetical protein